jgi:hypothetical protein
MRHDQLVQFLRAQSKRAGRSAEAEPEGLNPDSKNRADLIEASAGKLLLTDVSVVHPLAKSHQPNTAQGQLRVVRDAETEKRNKHRAAAQLIRAEFFPFVVETTGGLGQGALSYLALLQESAQKVESKWTRSFFTKDLYHAVGVIIHKGTAIALRSQIAQLVEAKAQQQLGALNAALAEVRQAEAAEAVAADAGPAAIAVPNS